MLQRVMAAFAVTAFVAACAQTPASAPVSSPAAAPATPATAPVAASKAPALVNTDPAAVNLDPARARVTLPEPANPKLPSLILIGDSTVRNGQDDGQKKGADGQWGWGNPIAAYFDPTKVNVVNRAVGGLSSRTYLTSGQWERALAFVKAGDVVVMQFGHNDGGAINDPSRARATIKGVGEQTEEIDNVLTKKHETVHSYGWYLRKFISDTKAKGAIPVVCSPIPRKMWDAATGKVPRSKGDYAGWAEQVAQQENVGFIDLNELAAAKYDEMGHDAVLKMFPAGEERVHTNMAGAELNAQIVVQGIRRLKTNPLNKLLSAKGLALEDDRPVVDASKVKNEAPLNAKLPTFFVVGDSTVKSGGMNGMFGWGERIAPFFDASKINVVNHAIGGRSSRTFYNEGRWTKVLEQIKPGDTVIIQFGHNDGARVGDPAGKNRGSVPGIGPETVEEARADGSKEQVHTFGWYMAEYVKTAKAKGARVILVSPIPHKDKWESGRDFSTFAQWDEEVAKANGAQYFDLTMLVSDAYRKLGAAKVDTFFADPRTHTNTVGAEFNAERVVGGLKGLPGNPLGAYLSAKGASVAP
ncbi:MAG: rhamnogalacturonan acetylesterase [Massilia sp.]